MQLTTKDASNKSKSLVEAILMKMGGMNKCRRAFISSTLILFLSMRGKRNFLNFSRYGEYCEKSYRLHFEQSFDFWDFNQNLVKQNLGEERIIAFDPSYIPKSGKKTARLGKFWSGCASRSLKGLEISGIAAVGLAENTALSLEAVGTPNQEQLATKEQTLVDHYAELIIERGAKLVAISKYLACDGYFSKINFIDPIVQNTDLHIISKLRKDADLKYLYQGPRTGKRGRPKKYDGKIDLKNIDRKRFNEITHTDDVRISTIVCWAVSLKRKIHLSFVEFLKQGMPTGKYALYFCTDIEIEPALIYPYYKARYHIEFLFRDAKQHTGLTDSQARDEQKLDFQFNASLTAVNIAKAAHYLKAGQASEQPISLADVNATYFNELMLNLFLSNFDFDPDLPKNKTAIRKLLSFGKIAA